MDFAKLKPKIVVCNFSRPFRTAEILLVLIGQPQQQQPPKYGNVDRLVTQA